MSISPDVSGPHAVQPHRQPSRFIVSLIWGVLAFIALCIGFEFACQASLLNQQLPVRSVGSYHAQFEIKWFKLEDYVRQNGGVDVIILGNSMVNTGVDPEILAARYRELTGTDLRIFNFGVEGLTVAPLSTLAQILEERYHPGTLLLYTEMRDYTAANGLPVETQFMANDWIKAQQSTADLKGRLIDSSAGLQRLLPFRNWSRADFLDTYLMDVRRIKETTSQGYEADKNTGSNIDQIPDPNDPEEKKSYDLFSNYSMDSKRIADLLKIIDLQNLGTKVLASEFPVYPTYYAYFGPESVVEKYHQDIEQIVSNANSHFLPAVSYKLLPLEDRVDNHHLNFRGAPLFSELLAEQLADLCKQQQNCLQKAASAAGGQP